MLVLPIPRDVVDGRRGLVLLPGWYGVVLGAQIYTRLGGTNMIQTINGCQGRRMTETTAARGVDTSVGVVTGITVTGIAVTGITVTGIIETGIIDTGFSTPS